MFHSVNHQKPHDIDLIAVKRQCSIMPDFKHDDELLNVLIETAFNACQAYTNKMLTKANVTVVYPNYKPAFVLPFGEIDRFKSIENVFCDDGEEITDYQFRTVSNKLIVPASYQDKCDFTVTYNVGYQKIPMQALQGIYLFVNTLYQHREDFVFVVGETVSKVPTSSLLLWDTIKNYAI